MNEDYKKMMFAVGQLTDAQLIMMCRMLAVTNAYFEFVRAGVVKPSDDMVRRINTMLELFE